MLFFVIFIIYNIMITNLNDYRKYKLNEAYNPNDIINVVLDKLEPTIQEMLAEIQKWWLNEFEKPMTAFEIEMNRLGLIIDMAKAFGKYTKPTDILYSIDATRGVKGSIDIHAVIERDGVKYPFDANAIYAGGHNIQRLHYRYITKTNIPQTNRADAAKPYEEKIKRMTKAQKINAEIKMYEDRIAKNNEDVRVNSALTDEEIIAKIKADKTNIDWPSWEEMIRRDAAKNYNNSEEEYMQAQEENAARVFKGWKHRNITWKQENTKMLQKEVDKLKAKLNLLL